MQGSMDVGVLERIYMASYGSLKVREEPHRRNKFILPRLATQVFFMDDPAEVGRKVVMVHEPRSRRVFGGDDQPFVVPKRVEPALEIPLFDFSQVSGHQGGAPQVVPKAHVQGIEANFLIPLDDVVLDDMHFVQEDDLEPQQM